MKKILTIATGNKNKVKEIKSILMPLGFEVYGSDERLPHLIDVEEDADTLEGNALKKAQAIWDEIGGYVLADDSGLFVESLDGAPGVHSARYAGGANDSQANNEKLLQALEGKENRNAYFLTALALINPHGEIKILEGRCDGTITHAPQGEEGFGYDPLFQPLGKGQTFAQMTATEKNAISHRRKALDALQVYLDETDEDIDCC